MFPAGRLADTGAMGSPGWPLRCVIVDDSCDFAITATTVPEGEGLLAVGIAHSVRDAMYCLKELSPDVTLIDVHLGGGERL